MSDQVTAFNPPVVCQLLDGTRIRFARVLSKMWAEIAAEIQAERTAEMLKDIDADKTLSARDKILLRSQARDAFVPIHSAIDLCIKHPAWIERLLKQCAIRAGSTAEEAERQLQLIPPIEQSEIASVVAMLPVTKANKGGNESNPLMPGVDLTGSASSPESADSTESTPANSPTENLTSTGSESEASEKMSPTSPEA